MHRTTVDSLCVKDSGNINSKMQTVGDVNMRAKQRRWCASVPLVSRRQTAGSLALAAASEDAVDEFGCGRGVGLLLPKPQTNLGLGEGRGGGGR